MKKGLLVFVLRSPAIGDCTNGGVTSKVDKVVLIGEGIPEIFEPDEESPALYLKKKNVNGEYLYATPDPDGDMFPGMIGPMMGGNYIETSDSRFPNKYPIPERKNESDTRQL